MPCDGKLGHAVIIGDQRGKQRWVRDCVYSLEYLFHWKVYIHFQLQLHLIGKTFNF